MIARFKATQCQLEAGWLMSYRTPAGAVTQFLSEAAAPPIERLQPVRNLVFYRRQRSKPNWWWSATNRGHLRLESARPEVWAATMLDFDNEISWIATQPLKLHYLDAVGYGSHVPDLLGRYRAGGGLLVDARTPAHAHDAAFVRASEATRRACGVLGWSYLVVVDEMTTYRRNVQFLDGYKRDLDNPEQLQAQLLGALSSDSLSIGGLLELVPPAIVTKAHLFHLMWRRQILCDLDKPLRMTTPIWRPTPWN